MRNLLQDSTLRRSDEAQNHEISILGTGARKIGFSLFSEPADAGLTFSSAYKSQVGRGPRCSRFSIQAPELITYNSKYYTIPLPRRRGPVRFPVLIFCASPTSSPMTLLYVSESCCSASRICKRYVKSAEVFAVCSLKSSMCLLSLSVGTSKRLSTSQVNFDPMEEMQRRPYRCQSPRAR